MVLDIQVCHLFFSIVALCYLDEFYVNSVSLEHTLCINMGRVPHMIRNGHSSKVMICIIGLENTFFIIIIVFVLHTVIVGVES